MKASPMDYAKFEESLESPRPVYLLKGDDYLRRKVLEACRARVEEEGSEAFNWALFDLDKQPVGELLDTARTLPWMARRRWVYVRNAGGDEASLIEYLKSPSPTTTMVLEIARKPRKWPKLPVVETASRNPGRWIVNRVRQEGYRIEPQAARTLADLVGDNYQQLESELEKQFLHCLQERSITLDSVMEMTLQVRQLDVFALIDAMAQRDSPRALEVLERLFASGMAAPQILAMLYWNFRRVRVARTLIEERRPFQSILSELKIWSYRDRERELRSYSTRLLEQILVRIRETDRLCKTTSTDPRAHLERVVIDSCSARSV